MAKQRRQKRQQMGGSTLSLATIQGGAVLPLSPANFEEIKVEEIKGGSGAADHAISVFGSTDTQRAVDGSNVIRMNHTAGGITGGNDKKGGQGILTDVAVPALLLYANNTFKRKSFKKLRKSMRRRKSKRYTRGKR